MTTGFSNLIRRPARENGLYRVWARPLGLLLAGLLPLLGSGCAFRYVDRAGGSEHLFGAGRMRLETRPVGEGLTAVTSEWFVPGIVFHVGKTGFGVSLGYTREQRLGVSDTAALAGLVGPQDSSALRFENRRGAVWGFGHLSMRGLPGPETAVAHVASRSLGGFGVSLGREDSMLLLGVQGRRVLHLRHPDMFLSLAATNRHPLFHDLFALEVKAEISPPVLAATPSNP